MTEKKVKDEEALKNCCIVFDGRPEGVYYAGETVSGTVNLTLNKKKKYKEIVLRVQGTSEVKWSEHQPKGHLHHSPNNSIHHNHHHSHSKTVWYTGKETYFKTYNNLIEPRSLNDAALEYNAGVHKFAFSFSLPHNLPSSYEGTHGHVRYEVKVTVKRPNKRDTCFKALFTVMAIINLNQLSNMNTPYSMSRTKSLYFLFSNKGILEVTAETLRCGYVPGETINVNFRVKNTSKVKVFETKFALMQEVTYRANDPHLREKIERNKVICEFGGGVDKGEDKMISANMIVPPIPPSTFNYCSLINVKYSIKVKTVLKGMHSDLSCEFPVTVGTIPLDGSAPPAMNPTVPIVMPLPAPVPTAPFDPTQNMSFLARPAPAPPVPQPRSNPPTYEEAMMESNPKGESSSQTFAPSYPVYDPSKSEKR